MMPDPRSARSWRSILADAWAETAERRSESLNASDVSATALWARRILTHTDITVRGQIDRPDANAREQLVRCAAEVLEACAAVWQAFGPVAGSRQVHLLRRLERQLAEHERAVLAAEATYRLDRHAVTAPAKAGRLAIERLHNGLLDTATGLGSLEDSAVAFAAVAIRASQNVEATGRADGSPGRTTPPPHASLEARFFEISAHAQTLLEPEQHCDLPRWLSESLIIAAHSREPPRPTSGDHAVSACAQMRRGWLRLGARELLIDRALCDDSPARASSRGRQVAAAAAATLADTALATRADLFDSQLAWEHHTIALSRLVAVCLRALRGDSDDAQRAHEVLIDRLQRVVVALWLTDRSAAAQAPPLGTD
jgi:hypothetical protein